MEEKESFAERMLRKQGWTDGQGLGKTQQGIVDPIKPTLKFDKTGIGHDHAEEFTNVWINNLQNIVYLVIGSQTIQLIHACFLFLELVGLGFQKGCK